MGTIMQLQEDGMTMETGNMLGKMIEEQERQLDSAQHRLVIELVNNRLDVLREMQRRVLVDCSMISSIPSVAARSALVDVFHSFELRVQESMAQMDDVTQKIIAAYSDREEYEDQYERCIKSAMDAEHRFFGRREAATQYSKAAMAAKSMADAADRILQLRKTMKSKEDSLKNGQERIMGLIEEFIDRYQEKKTMTVMNGISDVPGSTAETSLHS